MPNLTDLGQPKAKLSFKKGSPAFKKRSRIAEAIAKKNPKMPMSSKFAIATKQTEKSI